LFTWKLKGKGAKWLSISTVQCASRTHQFRPKSAESAERAFQTNGGIELWFSGYSHNRLPRNPPLCSLWAWALPELPSCVVGRFPRPHNPTQDLGSEIRNRGASLPSGLFASSLRLSNPFGSFPKSVRTFQVLSSIFVRGHSGTQIPPNSSA
jgi:hypothetical protein